MDNINDEIVVLHQKIQQEINARKNILQFTDAKLYKIEKQEKQVLSEINSILEKLKNQDAPLDDDINFKIELTKFKNNIRKLIKEVNSDLNLKIDLIQDALSTSIVELETTLSSSQNNQVSKIIENIEAIKNNSTTSIINIKKQLESIREESIKSLDTKVSGFISNSEKKLKELSNEITTLNESMSTTNEKNSIKIQAITEFYKTRIDLMEEDIKILKDIAPVEQKIIVPTEQKQIPFSGLQKEINALDEKLNKSDGNLKDYKIELTQKFEELNSGTPAIQLGFQETLAALQLNQKLMNLINTNMQDLLKFKVDSNSSMILTKKSIEKIQKSLEIKTTVKEFEQLKITIANANDSLIKNLASLKEQTEDEVQKLRNTIETQQEKIDTYDKKLHNQDKTLVLISNEVQSLKENLDLLLDIGGINSLEEGE